MNNDEFSVTMKTSLHRPEAAALISEGYRIFARGWVAVGQALKAQLYLRLTPFWPMQRKRII